MAVGDGLRVDVAELYSLPETTIKVQRSFGFRKKNAKDRRVEIIYKFVKGKKSYVKKVELAVTCHVSDMMMLSSCST